jgi:DNA-directed RNA polymerase specialized sigma24 family protein
VRQIIGASHSNKSIGKSTDKRLTTSFDLSAFLNQLSPENYLNDLKKKWDVKNDGPYSLYMELNFQLTLFKANQHNTPHALSLQLVDNTNEPLPINNLAETLLKSVHESLDELEDQEAQLILNLHFDGLLNEEISTLLGLPLLNIEQLLHVSKIALKEELKDKWGA